MNWEIILSIMAISISFLSLIWFNVWPMHKKNKLNKTFILIKNFYNHYPYLNPWLIYKNDKQEIITKELIKQSVFAYGFDAFDWELIIKDYDHNPFYFQNIALAKNFTYIEIYSFWKFWKILNKKLVNIVDIVNKFNFIVQVNGLGQITYRDSLVNKIERSSISLCPTYDDLKLHGIAFLGTMNYNEKKLDLNNYQSKLSNKKEFIKELKSSYFSLNIKFKSRDPKKIYSYALNFKDSNIINIETNFHKNMITPDADDIVEFEQHKLWIEKSFHISFNDKVEKLFY